MAAVDLSVSNYEIDKPKIKSEDGKNLNYHIQCSFCGAHDIFGILRYCLHQICHRCLELIKDGDNYYCNICKELSGKVIANSGLTISVNVNKSPACNWCEINGECTNSIGHCEECKIWLCAECLKGHNRMPPLRAHNIFMSPKDKSQGALFCEAHPNETLECFCEACGVLTCKDCQLSIHRDHGSHRWVGEKAVQMKTSLEVAVKHLKQCNEKLALTYDEAEKARTSNSKDSLLCSIEKTRDDIESRTKNLLNSIQDRSKYLLNELNKKENQVNFQLESIESLIKKLQKQVIFAVEFANHLIRGMDTDPASLVQLFDAVKDRLVVLQERADCIIKDTSTNKDDAASEFNNTHKLTIGWSEAINSCPIFLGNLNSQDLTQFSGTVSWLPKNTTNNSISGGTHSNEKFDSVASASGCLASSEDDFLDSLAEIDCTNWTTDANQEGRSDASMGCAVCFGVGLLVHCSKCSRAYHLDCHLPHLTSTSLTNGWSCTLCSEDSSAIQLIRSANDGEWSNEEYLIACQILMKLLVHPDVAYFSASVCPFCSVPLLSCQSNISNCPAGYLYHRFAELRNELNELLTKMSNSKNLNDWLVELSQFLNDIANDNESKGISSGCQRAATQLRSTFMALVREYRPECEKFLCQDVDNSDKQDLASKSCNKIKFDPDFVANCLTTALDHVM